MDRGFRAVRAENMHWLDAKQMLDTTFDSAFVAPIDWGQAVPDDPGTTARVPMNKQAQWRTNTAWTQRQQGSLHTMYPQTLALVDDDQDYSEFLAEDLRRRGIEVKVFADSNDLLADPQAYEFGFYVLDLMLPGVDGQELLKILRRRTNAGVLVVSGRLGPEVFRNVVTAGADMYLAKPVSFEQVGVAIEAVQRRAKPQGGPASNAPWRLERASGELVAPDGARVSLSEADLAVMDCFVAAAGEVVERETLRARLGKSLAEGESDGINATIYRLRRRIERATPLLVPLQSRSRVGYVFKAPLQVV